MTNTDLWTELSKRTRLSRPFVKMVSYVLLYDGSIDPWLDHFVRQSLSEILDERK
ncbi:MAG: hypothetical protein JWN75_1176 [Candidatus Saccharibacteria bacterium]|nr:hypothetical protein [Candidatus Saccharibacteria bacterium]